jgi:integrase
LLHDPVCVQIPSRSRRYFWDVCLENIDKFSLQIHLNWLAQTRSRDRVLQVRAYLQAIFAEAVDQDFIGKDPARTIKVPAHLKETDKTVLSWDQLRAVLSRLGRCDRIVLELDGKGDLLY